MPGFGDSAVLILLALLLFGPKKLPQLARQLGKLMADFRRASNEFRTQMEEELRISEQADRQKQIAAIETTTTPASPAVDSPPDSPPMTDSQNELNESSIATAIDSSYGYQPEPPDRSTTETQAAAAPIATSGELSIMPPTTGLPTPTSVPAATHESELETETLHG